jgi:hypothetical protein
LDVGLLAVNGTNSLSRNNVPGQLLLEFFDGRKRLRTAQPG